MERSEAIKAKGQKRIDEIRKRDEEATKKREKVKLFHSEKMEEERKSIEPKLSECYAKLFSTEEKSR